MGNSGSRGAREAHPQPYRGDPAASAGGAPSAGGYGAPPPGPPPPMYAPGGAPPAGYNPYAAGPYGGGPMMYPMPPFSTPELLQAALFSGMPPQMFLHGGGMGGMPAPPMPPPRVEHATTIRNDVNLKKASLRLLRDRRDPGRLALEFQFDANVPCAVTVFFAHRSDESPATAAAAGGVGESSLLARLQPFRAGHPGVRTLFRKGLGQTYSQAVLLGHAAAAGRGAPGSFVAAPPLPSSSGSSSSASAAAAVVDGSSFVAAPPGFAGEYLDLRAFNEEELTNAPASGDGRGQPSSVLASPRAGVAPTVSPADAARYGALPPHLFPVVVVLQTVPEGDPDHAAALAAPPHGLVVPGTFGGRGGPGAGPAPGSAASRVGLQATYATFLHRTAEETKDQTPAAAPVAGAGPQQWLPSVAWVAKPMRQRIQVGGTVYELKEIYGMDGSSGAAAGAEGDRDGGAGGSSAAAGGAGADDGLLAGAECVVCLTDRRDTAVLPCRHMCLCYDCAQQLRLSTNKCPICRTAVTSLLQIKIDPKTSDSK